MALIQRGTCTFAQKAQNAEAAGYDAAIIFNEVGGRPGRRSRRGRTEHAGGAGHRHPGDRHTLQAGPAALPDGRARVSLNIQTKSEIRQTANIIADTKGRAARTVVVGAHLDSVPEGPGINDNGSGTATMLETALQISKLGIEPTNRSASPSGARRSSAFSAPGLRRRTPR